MFNTAFQKFINVKKVSILIETFETLRFMNRQHLKSVYQKLKNIPSLWKKSKTPLNKLYLILESMQSVGQVMTAFRTPLETLATFKKFKVLSKLLKWLPNHPIYISLFVITSAALKVLEIYQSSRPLDSSDTNKN